ncbi:MAG TPA: FAD-dependent oxidoreductase [Ilumatobacter sp.]|nr:FAD-dependent oxidoreductase [Ilumatobacter sp.]
MLANLFRSLDIGPVSLHCRIVSTAHQTTLARDHVVTPELLAYQEARARGGVGLIIMEAAATEPAGLLSDEMMAGYLPRTIDGYREMKRITEPYGTKVFVQLFHGGREQFGSGPRREIVSSGAVPSLRYHSEPRAMTTAEVEQVIESFARCAAIAAEGGLEGIEVSAAHNYLPAQFFTAETNHRNDRYAVPERFLLESIAAVREAAPGLAVGVRLTATAPAAQHVALAIAAEVDFFHVTTGDSATYVGGALIVPPPPWPHNIVIDHTKPFVELGPAVIATGRIVDAAEADAFIAAGKADAVGMNRALITDPDMPAKARRGDLDAVMRCIGCNVCIEHYHAHAPIACAQNPRTGRELHMSRPVAARDPKRVVVVGGGPAGLSAAAEAAAAGHHVVLYEARQRLGGQMSLAGNAPGHAELAASMRRNFEHLLDRPNVQIRLAVAADVRAVREVGADCVVIATGARPYSAQYELQGVEVQGVEVQGVELQGVDLLTAWQVLEGARVSGRVVIADWGGDTVALDCAELLATEGADVTLVTSGYVAGEVLHQYVRTAYLGRLHRCGVRLAPHWSLASAASGRVRFRNVFAEELEQEFDADVLVISHGRVPEDALSLALTEAGIAHRTAGDCRSPRGIEEAVLEGAVAVRELLDAVQTCP